MISSPWLAMLITLILCLIWMRSINFLTDKNVFNSHFSRKLIHIGTGPVFLLCWLLFPDKDISRYLAASVPFLIVVQIMVVGLGLIRDYTSVKSMARTGQKTELLKGPLFYGIIFVLITLLFWKSAHAVIALMILCGGDGAADLIGSRIHSWPIPWSKKKTILGSAAMFLAGTLSALLMIYLIIILPARESQLVTYVLPVVLISLVSTVTESISPSDYDNVTVPVVSLIMSNILL